MQKIHRYWKVSVHICQHGMLRLTWVHTTCKSFRSPLHREWLICSFKSWLVAVGFNSSGHIIAVDGAQVFPGFFTPVLTQLFFPKPPTTFLTWFCRGERRKYVGKKVCLNRGLNSQPPDHESDTLTTEPPRRGVVLQTRLNNSKFGILSYSLLTCSIELMVCQ